ncbi:hypothetical protein L218DRAFT_896993 [Marasmius fiardii PR-910]|nr:hypothetical protein L218DRAFT_896993 [Marasmius fiardii PR-910]
MTFSVMIIISRPSESGKPNYRIQPREFKRPHNSFIHDLLLYFSVAILYWDHIITLGQEIRWIWSHPKSRSSYFFFFLRYWAVLSNITVLVLGSYDLGDKVCARYSLYRQILLVITQSTVCILLTLRIYAIFNCNKRILLFMCGSAAILLTVAAYIHVGQKNIPFPLRFGCFLGSSKDSARRISWIWIGLFIYDTILFFLTASRTFRSYYRRRIDPEVVHVSLLSLMFRDGAIYFGVMSLSVLSNILTFYLCGPFMRGGLSSFASCVSVTMMCRLMLNLHASTYEGLSSRPGDPRRNLSDSDDLNCMEYADSPGTTSGIVLDSVIANDIPLTIFTNTSGYETYSQSRGSTHV